MAEKLQHIQIAAPGFLGLNTQDSPTSVSHGFSSQANNCVIDKFGRVGARKGWAYVTTTGGSALSGSVGIEVIHDFTSRAGTQTVLSAGNNLIFKGTTTLVDDTPVAATITANDWKMVTFNDDVYMFQEGHAPMMWDSSAADTILVSAHPSYSGTIQNGNEALAAYGRLWVSSISNNNNTIYWSDMLQGMAWTGGTSGSIDLTLFWPRGDDDVVALAAHNDRLIVFGTRSILIYAGANSPANMALEDTIDNIGCVSRNTVINTGSDVLFLSTSGLRSLSRTIQEKSAPFRDISKNVRDDLLVAYTDETESIKSVYSPEEAFVLMTFPTTNKVFCFDTRATMEDGSYRATTWSDIDPQALHRATDGTLYMGHPLGIAQYTGYQDNGALYTQKYYTTALTFGGERNENGAASLLKFLKKIGLTVVGSRTPVASIKWAYDYSANYSSQNITLPSSSVTEYGIAEYGVGEYTASVAISTPRVNTTGSGTVVTVGIESTINGSPFSIQKLDIYATIGRLY